MSILFSYGSVSWNYGQFQIDLETFKYSTTIVHRTTITWHSQQFVRTQFFFRASRCWYSTSFIQKGSRNLSSGVVHCINLVVCRRPQPPEITFVGDASSTFVVIATKSLVDAANTCIYRFASYYDYIKARGWNAIMIHVWRYCILHHGGYRGAM